MVMNKEIRSDKRIKNIIGIIQSCLILILIFLIVFMIIQINRLQGTARVINYAGLVRGATQREVKLEITGNQKDELIKYLDNILSCLLYTSDAADEEDSVDLGGRRIIKKKNKGKSREMKTL